MTDQNVEEFLEHFGVLGMHWGVRHDKPTPTGAPRSTNEKARMHARQLAKANDESGSGSVTRRKEIRATIASESAKSKTYKKAVEYHIPNEEKKRATHQLVGASVTSAAFVGIYGAYMFGPQIKAASAAGAKWVGKAILDYKFNKLVKNL